jgi:hypothetical protein
MAALDKLEELSAAVARKQVDLPDIQQNKQNSLERPTAYAARQAFHDGLRQDIRANEAAVAKKTTREATAWASDAELGTRTGQFKQWLGYAGSDIVRSAGYVAMAPDVIGGILAQFAVDDDISALHSKDTQYKNQLKQLDINRTAMEAAFQRGDISADELKVERAVLNFQSKFFIPLTDQEQARLDEPGVGGMRGSRHRSGRAMLNHAMDRFKRAEAIGQAFDNHPIYAAVNPLKREPFREDLAATYDKHAEYFTTAQNALLQGDYGKAVQNIAIGLANVIPESFGDIAANPAATFEYIAENAPSLFIGWASKTILAGINIAYGIDIYSEAIADYQKRNNGALPIRSDAKVMLAFSWTAATLEHVIDDSILKQFTRVVPATKKTRTVLNALANNGLTRTAGAAASGFVKEGFTEAAQTAIEENFSKLNADFKGEQIFEAFTIGGVVGGIYSGGGKGAKELAERAAKGLDKLAGRNDNKEIKAAFDAAVASGDISTLTNKESAATYSPSHAVGALVQRIRTGELSEEDTQATAKNIDALITAQDAELGVLVAAAETLKEASAQATEEELTGINEVINELVPKLLAAKAHRKSMGTARETLVEKRREDPDVIDEIVAAAKSEEDTPERTAAVDKAMVLLMQDPDAISEEQANELAKSPSLTEEQRTAVNHFTDLQKEANALQDIDNVSLQIITGREGFKGLNEYKQNITHAIRQGDVATAYKELAGLRQFYTDHHNKEQALTEGLEIARSGKTSYVVRDTKAESGYYVTTTRPAKFNPETNGGKIVHPTEAGIAAIQRLVTAVSAETRVLAAAGKQLRSSIDMASKSTSTSAAPAVNTAPVSPTVSASTAPVSPTVSASTASVSPTVSVNTASEGVTPPTVSVNTASVSPTVSVNTASVSPTVSVNTASEGVTPPTVSVNTASEGVTPPTVSARVDTLVQELYETELSYDAETGQFTGEAASSPLPQVLADASPAELKQAMQELDRQVAEANLAAEEETPSSPPATEAAKQADKGEVSPKDSTSDNPLIKEARDSVRKALLAMNFRFTDRKEEGSPDVSDIERIASKILSGTHNDDPAFLKDAAHALSYAIYQELGAAERSNVTRQWVEQAILHWLTTGEGPSSAKAQGVWIKVLALYNRLMSFFQSKEYHSILENLENTIADIKTGKRDFSYKPREGFTKLDFQREMDNNPQAVKVLLALTAAGINFALTGSVAYADQVPVYRRANTPLHDIDLLLDEQTVAAAQKALSGGPFGKSGQIYKFKVNGKTIVGVAVVPAGYEVRNVHSGWRPKSNAVYRTYEVYDTATNEKVGSYSYEAGNHETFEGIAGVTVDLISSPFDKSLTQTFTSNGREETIKVASYVPGFAAKLQMLRYKDVQDFLAVVPPPTGEVIEAKADGAAVKPKAEEQPTLKEEPSLEEQLRESFKRDDTAESGTEAIPVDSETGLSAEASITIDGEVVESGKFPLDPTKKVVGNMTLEQIRNEDTNILEAYVVQRGRTALAMAKDFMSLIFAGGRLNTDVVLAFLPGQESLSDKQVELLLTFSNMLSNWGEQIRTNIDDAKIDAKYTYRDIAQELKGKQPENLQTAIALAAFTYIADNGGGLGYNSTDQIRAILGLSDEDHVTDAEYSLLQKHGNRQSFIIEDLGDRVLKALDWGVHKDSPDGTLTQLKIAFGTHAYALLVQGEHLTTKEIAFVSAVEEQQDATQAEEIPDQTRAFTAFFARISRDEADALTEENAIIYQAAKETGSLLNKLFGLPAVNIAPASEPGQFDQKTVISGQNVPVRQQEIAKTVSEIPHHSRKDVRAVRQALSTAVVEELIGIEDLTGKSVHEGKRKGVESRNEDLRRELAHLVEFEAENGDKPFYFQYSFWIQQRAGILSNIINTLSSKLHRHSIKMDLFTTTVAPSKQAELDRFLIAVGLGMGVKVDKKSPGAALADIAALLSKEEIKAAVAALNKVPTLAEGTLLSQAEQDAIATAVTMGGAAFHSLEALVNYAGFVRAGLSTVAADNEGKAAFSTDLSFEIDGVANGTALALSHFGVIPSGWHEKLGFGVEEGFTSYPEWREKPGNSDVYETIVTTAIAEVNSIIRNKGKGHRRLLMMAQLPTLFALNRDAFKTPVISFFFGAGMKKVIAGMADEVITKFYSALEDIANDKSLTKKEQGNQIHELVKGINEFLGTAHKLPLPKTIRAAMTETTLSRAAVVEFSSNYNDQMKSVVAAAFEKEFGHYTELKNYMNAAPLAAFNRYKAAYDYLYEHRLNELVASGELATAHGAPLQGLDSKEIAKIQRELGDLFPVMHSAFSSLSNDRAEGISLVKQKREQVHIETSPAYSQEVHLGNPVPRPDGRTTRTISTSGSRMVQVDPGVSAPTNGTHSSDAYVAHTTVDEVPGYNIHDAVLFGLGSVVKGGVALNRNVYQMLINYSLPWAMAKTLQDYFRAEDKLIKKYPGLKTVLEGVGVTEGFADQMSLTAAKITLNKLNQLSSVHTVNQYASTEGSYKTTQEDRDAIAKLIAHYNDIVVSLQQRIEAEGKSAPASASPPATAPVKRLQASAAPTDTPWGVVGAARTASDPAIVKILEKSPTLKSLLPALAKHIKSKGKLGTVGKFQLELLRIAYKTAHPDTKIQWITPDSTPDAVAENIKNARGGYYISGNTIYIKSPEFADSGVTTELALHEIVHAVLSQIIAQNENATKPGENPEAYAAVQELKQLHVLAAQYVADNKLESKFGPAVANLQELVAWGMTNVKFQTEVLGKIQMPVTNTATSAVSRPALKQFIHNLATIFFGSRINEFKQNGMGVMLANVGVLFEGAYETNRQSQTGKDPTVLTMADSNPDTFSTDEIFSALASGNPDPEWATKLRSVLAQVTGVVYGPYGSLRAAAHRAAPTTPEEVYRNAVDSGETPFASKLRTNFPMNEQEAFVAESTELTIRAVLGKSRLHIRELERLWEHAKKSLFASDFYAGDWSLVSDQDRTTAEAQYRQLFTITANASGGTDYLSQFVAAALTYKPLNDRLSKLDVPRDEAMFSGETMLQRIGQMLKRMFNVFSRWQTNTSSAGSVALTVQQLAYGMATLEKKRNEKIRYNQARADTWLETNSLRAANTLKAVADKVANSAPGKNSKLAVVRTLKAVVATVAGDRSDLFLEGLSKVLRGAAGERNSFASAVVNEIRNGRDSQAALNLAHNVMTKHQQEKVHWTIETANYVEKSFGRKLTDAESAVLSDVVLRTDASALLTGRTLADIDRLLSTPAELQREIKSFEQRLVGSPAGKYSATQVRNYYLASAKATAYFMVTGRITNDNLMMNAHNIAFLANTLGLDKVSETTGDAAAADLDQLISLYALRYVGQDAKNQAVEILREQSARKDENGFETVMKLHRGMQEKAQEQLFDQSPIHMMKGYTKDAYNPHVKVVAATKEQGIELVKAGYVLIDAEPLGMDIADPVGEARYLYKAEHLGLQPFIPGFLANTGKKARGSTRRNVTTDPTGNQFNFWNGQHITTRKSKAIGDIFDAPTSWDPRQASKRSIMAPVINLEGKGANYRYLMNNRTKNSVLGRENRVNHVLGNLAGSIFDKAGSAGLNQQGVDVLKEHYDREFLRDQKSFINVSKDSADPEVRERYNLLPTETKRYIRKVWKREGMWVHRDAYDIALGYRKFSLADALDIDVNEDQLGKLEKIYAKTAKMVLGTAAGLKIARAETVEQEIVRDIKDTYVIRSLDTLLGNESSNATVLFLAGVPIKDILVKKAAYVEATVAYMSARTERDQLTIKLDFDLAGADLSAVQQRIIQLNESMQRNPMHAVVEAGLLQTLVEDIGHEPDEHSYKSQLTKWISSKTERIPGRIKNAGKTVLMTHDTAFYKLLNRSTVFSDFTSRAILYEHLTTRRHAPMSKEEAIRVARKTFVNYDIPTNKALQWSNDVGLLWFTKYYLRIQAVILQLVRDNPIRALALIGANNLYSFSDILDSNFLSKSPVNLGAGALEFPGSIDERITISAPMSLLD